MTAIATEIDSLKQNVEKRFSILESIVNQNSGEKKRNIFSKLYSNEFIITWILHQIFMFSNKVNLAAG